jgi:4-amino-4-deoxy-L-arabinose transferase-like glycosyltransferase
VFGLCTILALWWGLRIAFSSRVALWGACFLGLEHASFLYNRMALLDTPAAFLGTAAFALFALSVRSVGSRALAALFASGLILSGALITRTLAVFLIAGPIAAFWVARSSRGRVAAWTIGLLLGIGLYAVLWYFPNRAEISRMGAYYLGSQLAPPSFLDFLGNLGRGILGDHRGVAPYLVRHAPVWFGLALAALIVFRPRFRPAPSERITQSPPTIVGLASGHQVATVYLWAWLAGALLLYVFVNYAPSRYYVTAFPAMAGLAALAVDRLTAVLTAFRGSPLLRALFAAFFAYHLLEAFVHRGGVLSPALTWTALLLLPLATAVAAWRWQGGRSTKRAAAMLGLAWLAGNGYWTADWLRSLDYSQLRSSRELARTLPTGSVLLGDVAPGLCMDNRHLPVNVIPGLCNWVRPVEGFAGRPRFIAILDGRFKEKYWLENYPELVESRSAILRLNVMRWEIGVYRVSEGYEGRSASDRRNR